MKLRRLMAPALVVPLGEDWMNKPWQAQVLGVGSVVELVDGAMVSPITHKVNEIYIKWVDIVGRQVKGWLAAHTPMDHKARELSNVRGDLQIGPWDQVREAAFNTGNSAKDWLIMDGPNHVDLLHRVVRELGGKSKKTDSADELIIRAIRLTTGETLTMSEVNEAREGAEPKSSKKGGAKKSSKKSSKKAKGGAKAPARSMARTTGETLLPLLKKVGASSAVKYAVALSSGKTLKKSDLQKLRDLVNEAAEKAREKKQGAVASTLSSANRLVRRLARKS